jgi:hypothetical protein
MRLRLLTRLGSGACALVICGVGWAAFAPDAGAVSGVQTGYWSSLPAAPQVPAGGIEVASNPNGAQAVAAIRFVLADGETQPVITLKVAQAQPASQVTIEACAVAAGAAGWTPPPSGGPGAMDAAPKADCSGGLVSGIVAADGTTVTFDLTPVNLVGSTVNVLLFPGMVAAPTGGVPGAPSSTYPAYDAAFQPVEASQIAVTAGSTSVPSSSAPPPPAGTSSGGVAYPAPAPAPPANAAVALPPATSSGAGGGVAPVIAASPQPTNVAAAAPALLTKKRNLRLLFGIAMLSSDVLFALLWLERRAPGPEERPLISIYDPPPLAS